MSSVSFIRKDAGLDVGKYEIIPHSDIRILNSVSGKHIE
jgi:hypothetical protein